MVRHGALLIVTLFVLPALAGCLGGSSRSDWAYEVTQIDAAMEDGRTGRGVRVGVLDTGVDVDHPSLDHLRDGEESNGELVGFRDYYRNENGIDAANDPDGHGTHVIGIMSGRGSSFGDRLVYGGIDLQGGSPGIQLFVAKVCDADGCSNSAINSALDWMDGLDLDVLSLSLGGQRGIITVGDAMRDRINDLIDSGVVVVAAAGNSGPCGEETHNDVDAPADIPGVIAVGAIDSSLEVSCISSRGDNGGTNACTTFLGQTTGRCDPSKKPELVAPGVDILSAWADGQYGRATGTSQAAPFVTSVVALMLEGHRPLQSRNEVLQVKQVLKDTALPLEGQSTPHDEAYGYGLVQAADAIAAYG